MESGKDTVDHNPGIFEALIAEEYPAKADKMEREEHGHRLFPSAAFLSFFASQLGTDFLMRRSTTAMT